MDIEVKMKPELDPLFLPAALWNRTYRTQVHDCEDPVSVSIALIKPDETSLVYSTQILPMNSRTTSLNLCYLERIIKFLLWQRGGSTILVAGCDELTTRIASMYAPGGEREFDYTFFSEKIYLQQLEIRCCGFDDIPEAKELVMPLGRYSNGCRIGFDLGGSDRKCAAVIDGEVVFTEEIKWNPYFESDPNYHIEGINDTLQRAAIHLPHIDAIGGSAAGVYVDNEVRVASLFRGVSDGDFESKVRRIFFNLKDRWGGIPFEVINDGEVTALAGSMSLNENAVLGLAMGTSEAVGYITPEGNITSMLNELAFAPVDYRADAPADEWSGDIGCGVQYFSQQAVARLAPAAGLVFPENMSLAERLTEVQERMAEGDELAGRIYSTIGVYLGYTIAHYADFYDIRILLLLGRVMSGKGGAVIIEKANEVLVSEFPQLAERIRIMAPGEKEKRHGQAVMAASLPSIGATA